TNTITPVRELYSHLSPLSLFFFFQCSAHHRDLHSFPTRRSSDLLHASFAHEHCKRRPEFADKGAHLRIVHVIGNRGDREGSLRRSEEHTSELQSRGHLVCRLLLEKKKKKNKEERRTIIEKSTTKH